MALTVSCKQAELPEAFGEAEKENTYGVYFPPQTSSTNLQLEADEPTEVTYRVRRANALDPIIVPAVMTVKVGGEEVAEPEKLFKMEPIAFYAGEEEAKFKVTFPDTEIGKEYTVNIRIEDPNYIEIYGKKETGLSFKVLRANWKHLGKGKWRDDIISSMYGGISHPNAEIEIDIYEREDLPGYYRMQVFTKNFVKALFGQEMETENLWTIVDASNPEEVWLPRQSTGLQINSSDGVVNIASSVDRIFSMDASENSYGTLDEHGVITFPVQGILVNIPGYDATGWFATNASGLQRIMLPGAREYDYSVTLVKSEAVDGILNMDVTFGVDVKTVRYKIFEGVLDDAQASLYAQDLDDGKEVFDGELSASGNLEIKDLETGEYTLVACSYADGTEAMRAYAFMPFGFVAEGDERPIVLTFGLEATDEYAGIGINTDNSARFYAYGKDLVSLKMALVRTDRLKGIEPLKYVETVGTDFKEEELQLVNNGHFSKMLTSLNGNSEYTLILLADNGYRKEVLTATYKTTGTFNPLLETYTYNDFIVENPDKEGLLAKSYSLYGVNLMDEEPELRRIGSVTLKDDTENDQYTSSEIIDFIRILGFTGLTFDTEEYGILGPYLPGTTGLSLYNGQFGLYTNGQAIGKVGGQDIYIGFIPIEDMNIYNGIGMFAGKVADGYYAIVPNPEGSAQGMTFTYFCAFNNGGIYSMLCDMVLVDDSKNPVLPGKTAMESRKEHYKALKASIEPKIPELLLNGPRVIGDDAHFPVKVK